jgi:hypothetical protein
MTFPKTSSPTIKVASSASEAHRAQIREQARREIPALRRQAEQGIATLQRLAERADK